MFWHRVSGLGSKTGAEPVNRTLVSFKELYRQVYVQPENGDMGSKRLSDAMFDYARVGCHRGRRIWCRNADYVGGAGAPAYVVPRCGGDRVIKSSTRRCRF